MPRDVDWRHLHPAFRVVAEELSHKARVLQLQMYEGARTPLRQAELYARGRTTGDIGRTVTHAGPWESFHQYGLAGDWVFNIDGRWTWDEPKPGRWAEFRRIAQGCGLRVLSFEVPHVELPVSLADLQAGRFPVGGDSFWEEWLETQIEIYPRGAPPAPTIQQRPETAHWEAFPLPPSPF
jgi:hypothetical protein